MAPPEVDPTVAADEPARLLHADEERLRLVAVTLSRGGRLVLVVADSRLWSTALQFLRERLSDHRFIEHTPTSHDETNQAISDPLRNEPGLTSVIRLTGREAEPIETLNLRRESLVKAPANFLVVLDGEVAHARFLREAPDCYSYRDLLVVLQGEPVFETPEHHGSDDDDRVLLDAVAEVTLNAAIEVAKQEADPSTRARRLFRLGVRLLADNQIPSRKVFDEVITTLTALHGELSDDDRLLLAAAHGNRAFGCSRAETYRHVREALEVLAPVADRYAESFANIAGQMVDAIGLDLEAARDAVRRAQANHGGSAGRQLLELARAYRARGNLVHAREVLAEIDATDSAILGTSIAWIRLQFNLLVEAGAWSEADQLVSFRERVELFREQVELQPRRREPLHRLRAELLSWRGEGRAAQRIYDRLSSNLRNALAKIRLTADGGRVHDASVQIEQILQRPWTAYPAGVDDLLAIHELLVYVTEEGIAAGGSVRAREDMDARLAMLRQHIERTEAPDPPWSRIDCMLLQADAYLKRTGAEHLALSCAEQAWQLASAGASLLEPRAARRCIVAALRMGQLDEARDWLSRGLKRAREHELRGDKAELRGLALWHATLAGSDTASAEGKLQAAFAASGSKLIETSVLARVGAALGRHDLLRRAQQIDRSLPWPAREGACLEALGETQIAEARYRTFGLVTRSTILARRSEPPPITAVDDD